jgi:hypothetical protein
MDIALPPPPQRLIQAFFALREQTAAASWHLYDGRKVLPEPPLHFPTIFKERHVESAGYTSNRSGSTSPLYI